MKLAWLCPLPLFPVDSGGRRGIFSRIKYCHNRGDENYVYCYLDNDNLDADSLPSLLGQYRTICKEVRLYNRFKRWGGLWHAAMKGLPYTVASRDSSDLVHDLLQDHERVCFDAVLFQQPQACASISTIAARVSNIVIDQHNVEWRTFQSIGENSTGLKRAAYLHEAKAMKKFESELYGTVNPRLMSFVSDVDKENLTEDFDISCPTCVSPPGLEEMNCSEKLEPSSKEYIAFVGSMDYPPNDSGAKWLISEVMLHVWKTHPQAHLLVVGRKPGEWLQAAGANDERITVTGYVEDVKPFYEMADVVVIPISSGGGIKIKTIEAASSSRPIVSTNHGIAGTGLIDGRDVLVADGAHEFADAICSLLSGGNYASIVQSCHRQFERHLSMSSSCAAWRNAVEDVCK